MGDLDLNELSDGQFAVVSSDNFVIIVENEEAACLLQRQWRALHGCDVTTGEPNP